MKEEEQKKEQETESQELTATIGELVKKEERDPVLFRPMKHFHKLDSCI